MYTNLKTQNLLSHAFNSVFVAVKWWNIIRIIYTQWEKTDCTLSSNNISWKTVNLFIAAVVGRWDTSTSKSSFRSRKNRQVLASIGSRYSEAFPPQLQLSWFCKNSVFINTSRTFTLTPVHNLTHKKNGQVRIRIGRQSSVGRYPGLMDDMGQPAEGLWCCDPQPLVQGPVPVHRSFGTGPQWGTVKKCTYFSPIYFIQK